MNTQSSLLKKFIVLSSITLAGSFMVNVLNYLFTVTTGRLLGPSLFGEIAVLTGFFLLIAVPSSTLTLYVAKETARLRGLDLKGEIRRLFRRSTLQAMVMGVIGLAFFSVCVPFLSEYLKIDASKLFLFGLLIPFALLGSVTQGIFQGYENFSWFSFVGVSSAVLKFVLAVIAVLLGWGVMGVIGALIIATFTPYIASCIKLKKMFVDPSFILPAEGQEIFSLKAFLLDFNFMFFASLGLALLFNMDIIVAKHYLDPIEAGHYAALSTLGKIILYACLSLVQVMFPMISSSQGGDAKKNAVSVLRLALLLITVFSFLIITGMRIFPALSVGVLFGSAYYPIIPYLLTMGIAMYFLTIINALTNYFIAIRARKVVYVLLVGVLVQIFFLIYFPHTIAGITRALAFGQPVIVLGLLVFYYMVQMGNPADKADQSVEINNTNELGDLELPIKNF